MRQCKCATSFPSPSAMGNAFNKTLYHLVGHAIGTEGKAVSALRPHNQAIGDGLTYWSPTINLQRDPRWGRNQEVPGEDPHLTSVYAREFVDGLQSITTTKRTEADDQQHDESGFDRIRLGACCKHFVANSLEQWKNFSRHNFDAQIDHTDLYDYYFPPFQECVKQAVGVMCSYNSLNGKPACANPWLLQHVLRKEMNFTGYLVSDCGALSDVEHGHKYASDSKQAAAMAKNSGVDINCGNGDYFPKALLQAHEEGMVEDVTVIESFRRMATVQFRLGLFDVSEKENDNPQRDISMVGSPQHGQLALEAALQSIVLLQNKGGLLPLDRNMRGQVAVIGPHLNATEALLSNYHGSKCDCPSDEATKSDLSCIETPLVAISRKLRLTENVKSVMGCNVAGSDRNEIEAATLLAQDSDLVILLLGLDNTQEREALDRNEIELPGLQSQLLQSILDVAAERTVIALVHGGALALGQDVKNKAGAVLSCGYGGQSGAEALASVVFGEVDPSGKLAATWYPADFVNELPLTEMGLTVGVGRTHRYYSGIPEFPFGHGLSYSNWYLDWWFNHTDNVLGASGELKMKESETVRIAVRIQNLGSPDYQGTSSQTILLFWRPLESQLLEENRKLPRKKLVAFYGSKPLREGDIEEMEFEIKWGDFALWSSKESSHKVLPGMYRLDLVAAGTQLTKTVQVVHSQDRIETLQ
ncbi:MAG: hypothetical protein SGILL_002267 [Bacillariaceae sp.]